MPKTPPSLDLYSRSGSRSFARMSHRRLVLVTARGTCADKRVVLGNRRSVQARSRAVFFRLGFARLAIFSTRTTSEWQDSGKSPGQLSVRSWTSVSSRCCWWFSRRACSIVWSKDFGTKWPGRSQSLSNQPARSRRVDSLRCWCLKRQSLKSWSLHH